MCGFRSVLTTGNTMNNNHLSTAPMGEFIFFASDDGRVKIECRFEGDTLWLPQATMAQLYQVSPQAITQHIKAVYEEGEFEQKATCKDYLQVRFDGNREVKRQVLHYSLPVILAVGYRVRSLRGMQFRQWATNTLQENIVKGFVVDDERLKNPPVGEVGQEKYHIFEVLKDEYEHSLKEAIYDVDKAKESAFKGVRPKDQMFIEWNEYICDECGNRTMIPATDSQTGYQCTFCKSEDSGEIEADCCVCGCPWPNEQMSSWNEDGESICPRCLDPEA